MKQIIIYLHRSIDESIGRNEKIKSRIDLLKKNNWEVQIFYIYESKNSLIKVLNLLKATICSLIKIKTFKTRILVIWTMNAPSYLHISGFLIKFFIKDILWITEFRDTLCEEPFFSRKGKLTQLINPYLEKKILTNADSIIIGKGSQNSYEYFSKNYPRYLNKITEIPYLGYDYRNFNNIAPKIFEKFTISYTGRLYDDWIEPINFLLGLTKFINLNSLTPKDIQVFFYIKGWKDSYTHIIKSNNIDDYVFIKDYVDKKKLLSILKGSNLLLFINGSKKSKKHMIHSKFWEYVASKTPILLLAEKDFDIYKILKDYELGYFANEHEPENIAKELQNCYVEYQKSKFNKKSIEDIFKREKHDYAFLNIIENLI